MLPGIVRDFILGSVKFPFISVSVFGREISEIHFIGLQKEREVSVTVYSAS